MSAGSIDDDSHADKLLELLVSEVEVEVAIELEW